MASKRENNVTFTDPPFLQALFSQTRWAWIWLIVRLYLAYMWLESGIGKLTNPGWVSTGEALKGFWERAVAIPDAPARPLIAFGWYRTFLETMLENQSYTWFAKVITAGEILVGLGLLLGAFTGIAAFFSGFLNWNFMMAGTASSSPVMFPLAVFLVLAWKIAGWWGLDRWILPAIGTPWQPGTIFRRDKKVQSE